MLLFASSNRRIEVTSDCQPKLWQKGLGMNLKEIKETKTELELGFKHEKHYIIEIPRK